MMAAVGGDGDDAPYVVHLLPTIAVEAEASSTFEAQVRAINTLSEQLDATELTVVKCKMGVVGPDVEELLGIGGDETEMWGIPDEDTDLDIGPEDVADVPTSLFGLDSDGDDGGVSGADESDDEGGDGGDVQAA